MSYLYPPPEPAPIVVVKDVGGLVSDYRERTALYRTQNREVRLHECRSACTLALSLPNVCVYPSSLLKFHQAYNQITNEADLGITDELWQSYPQAVRARLGTLTRQYKVIRGDELIALGVRDCASPKDTIMVARAKAAQPVLASASVPQKNGTSVLASLGDTFKSLVGQSAPTAAPTNVPGRPASAKVSGEGAKPPVEPPKPIPEPPPRPTDPIPSSQADLDVPLPPVRPPLLARAEPMPSFARPIAGSQPILPSTLERVATL